MLRWAGLCVKRAGMQTVVLLFSGGLDSTVALYDLQQKGLEVKCLSVLYGQRHQKELASAEAICGKLGIERKVADLESLKPFLKGNSQTDQIEVPEGHYAEETMKLTVVPNRNMIMLSIAIGWAISLKYDAVAYAAHTGDHTIYPDCREEFIESMQRAAKLCDWHTINLISPFSKINKTQIVELGAKLKVPFADTWSCYKGLEKHCGKCGTCTERKEAFQKAGLTDPTEYLA